MRNLLLGRTYSTDATPMPIENIIQIGIRISEALVFIHQAKAIHQDVRPDNILVKTDADGAFAAQIINFTQSMGYHESSNYDGYASGTLSYLSPEQTGRLNRLVDYRTDFYSFGITLWEMITGILPFTDTNPLNVIYAHMARNADNPMVYNNHCPRALSQIVLKLIMKDPIDRYQSANAIAFDLKKCLDIILDYKQENGISPITLAPPDAVKVLFDQAHFEIGTSDFSPVLIQSQALYGREMEYKKLLSLFQDTASGKLKGHMVCLRGETGVGKSILVNAVAKECTSIGICTLMADASDEETVAKPFSAMINVMAALIRTLLTKSPELISKWKNEIITSLGPKRLSILRKLIPAVKSILNIPNEEQQPESADLRQLYKTIAIFLKSFLTTVQPLVIFFLHYQISPELAPLLKFLCNSEIEFLLIIVQVNQIIGDKGSTDTDETFLNVRITYINMYSISLQVVEKYLESMMKPLPPNYRELASILHARCRGNPMAMIDQTRQLEKAGLISFDFSKFKWVWDIKEISSSIDVLKTGVDTLLAVLDNMKTESMQLLKIVACINSDFDAGQVSNLMGLPKKKIVVMLISLVRDGLILCNNELDNQSSQYNLHSKLNSHKSSHSSTSESLSNVGESLNISDLSLVNVYRVIIYSF